MHVVYFDGACNPNPGQCSYGVSLQKEGCEIDTSSSTCGHGTNNIAEYHGLIAAIQLATSHDLCNCEIRGDSQLVINQMTGKYKTKNKTLLLLQTIAQNMINHSTCTFSLHHVKREFNSRADELAKNALLNQYGP